MGRPKLKDSQRKKSITVTLSKEHIELLKALGNNNASEGIRTLIQAIPTKKTLR